MLGGQLYKDVCGQYERKSKIILSQIVNLLWAF
jgi:hypothetical protein